MSETDVKINFAAPAVLQKWPPLNHERVDFKSLSIDELWAFRERIATALGAKMLAEKRLIEDRLRKLNLQAQHDQIGKTRRSYPIVLPKYRNPQQPSETWTGRGKQPRWLVAQLKSGKRLDDFRI